MRSRFVLAVATALLTLSACGGIQSAVIRNQALSYDDVIEDTTDKLLLLNILRAKDKAPLHFDEIPTIHESIQATVGIQAAIPFGGQNDKFTGRDTLTPSLGVAMTPTFDLSHLDTKDFVTGMATPVDPKFVKYWLDRGLDRRIVLLLFFSSAIITEWDPGQAADATKSPTAEAIRVMNSPRAAIDTLDAQATVLKSGDVPDNLRCNTQADFQHYLKLIDSLGPLAPHYFTERRKVASGLQVDPMSSLKDLTSVDPNKYQLVPHDDNAQGDKSVKSWDLYAISAQPRTELCPISADGATNLNCIELDVESAASQARPATVTMAEESPWPAPAVERPADNMPTNYCKLFNAITKGNGVKDADNPSAQVEIRLQLRSVGEMIQFLGDLLEYQEELNRYLDELPGRFRLHDPLTFGYCGDEQAVGCGDLFFDLPHTTCNSRFAVDYRGQTYAVPNYNTAAPGSNPCQKRSPNDSGGPRDHTLELLAVVHQMVDLQKSAQDIRETPYVQILP